MIDYIYSLLGKSTRPSGSILSCEQSKILVEQYFARLDRIYLAKSDPSNIDDLMKLMHTNVKYKHLDYGANFSKSQWEKAFLRNLKRGVFTAGPEKQTRVISSIFGKNHMAVEYSIGELTAEGAWQSNESRLAIFRFQDNLISMVEELW